MRIFGAAWARAFHGTAQAASARPPSARSARRRPASGRGLTAEIVFTIPASLFKSDPLQDLRTQETCQVDSCAERSDQRLGELSDGGGPADDRALRADHLEGRLLEFGKVAFRGVLDQQALIAAIVRLAHGGLDA